MSSWNMPPGCTTSDIPGNRPEDVEYEKLVDEIETALKPIGPFDTSDNDNYDQAVENIMGLIIKAFGDGHKQAHADDAIAAMEHKNDEQIFLRDLGAYIRVARQVGRPVEEVLATIVHDISGRIAGVAGFLPKCDGYAEVEAYDEGGESNVGCND